MHEHHPDKFEFSVRSLSRVCIAQHDSPEKVPPARHEWVMYHGRRTTKAGLSVASWMASHFWDLYPTDMAAGHWLGVALESWRSKDASWASRDDSPGTPGMTALPGGQIGRLLHDTLPLQWPISVLRLVWLNRQLHHQTTRHQDEDT